MATTTPIDVERYLFEGLELEPTKPERKLPVKPNLNDALRNHYNSTAPPGSRQLAPGETPEPVSTEVQGPPAPGILNRLPSLPSFGGGTAPVADRSIAGATSPLSSTPTPITRGPSVPGVTPPATPTPTAPLEPTKPLAAGEVPGAAGAKPSGWYDTIQKHAGFVRDMAEAGGNVLAGAGAFAFGAATAVSDILNAQLARVSRGGIMAGGPESSTHYRDIFARMDKTISDLTPEPRSDIAKNVNKVVGTVTGLVRDIAELPGKGLVATGIMNEDTARVLSFATELYLFYKLDRGVRQVAPELRSKVADFKTRMSKATSDADVAGAASDLADAAAKNPKLNDALGEARGKFRDEADFEAGREPGPRGPQPEGPAPGGATFDFSPEELLDYKSRLERASAEFDRLHPEGASIWARKEYFEQNVPKPKGTPRPAPEAPVTPPTEPAASPASEPTRVTPTEAPRAAPTAERPVQPEVVVGQETAVTRPTEVNVPPEVAPTPAATVQPRTTGVNIPPEIAPTPATRVTVPLIPSAAPETPVSAAATVAPEVVPAPPSGETPAVAAVPAATPTTSDAGAQARSLYERANAPGVRDIEYRSTLAELKAIVREGLRPNQSARANLERLGFSPEEIPLVEKQIKGVRAKVAEKPAVQTVATEAALDTMPAGTEAEIPRPAEPIVDSSPAIEKPKRVRRVVKAPTPAEVPIVAEAVTDYIRPSRVAITETGYKRQFLNEAVINAERVGALDEIIQRSTRGESVRTIQTALRASLPESVSSIAIENMIPAVQTAFGTRRLYEMRGMTKIPADIVQYHNIPNITALQDSLGKAPITPGTTNLPQAPLYVRSVHGTKPDAVFVDTARMNTRTSLADIDAQVTRGRMSAEVAEMMKANLQRQADIAGLPITEAHNFTGQELMREATRIAAETGIDLYVKKGKNYELVPKDVVRTDARLNRGDDLAATPISSDAAGAYVESKTSDIGPGVIRSMIESIEQGIDISERLPTELLPHYRAMRDAERAGIDTSERRAFIDILNDLNTMLGEEGSIGGNFTRAQRMAAQRLQADMRKAGKNAREFLFGARPEDVAMFERYLETINNPVPPNSTNPRNMRLDPENIIPGDKVVKHRKISTSQNLDGPPLWQSEVTGLQNARDIKPGGTAWDLKLPLRQHKAAGTEFIYYAYRTAQKNLNAELNVLHADMQELARGFSSKSLENIGANGYQRQGGDGQRILTYNKVTPQPLTSAERRLQATIDGIYANTFIRLNEVRAATGREPLDRVDDYQTFARTISLLNQLGIKVDLARATNAEVNAAYLKHKSTNFPYLVRKHAFYSAEMNALKILDTYMQSALKDIHLSPFLAKVHELIETNLPDPVTGKETWSLKDHKEGLYNELRTWVDYISTGTNWRIPDTPRMILNTLNKNVAYATLSGLLRSAGIQLSTLVSTQQALGPINTFNGVVANLVDHLSGGKRRQFALDNSEILSSRKFIEAYNEVSAAIIGRRPRDFFHAIRTGDFGSIQQAVGRPGFKLMELFDMEAAVMSWNTAYKQATRKMHYNHKDAVRFADDLVVRTQGSTMPGDLSGIQRNALGKLFTQFQTFLISDWNFLTHEVLSKGKTGGGGGGQIPPGGVPSGSGSWETGGKRSSFQLVKNAIQLLIATQLVNEFYKMLHIQPAQPDPVKDVQQGLKAGHGPIGLAWDIAVGQLERIPVYGGALRYGTGITGPATETFRNLVRASRNDPLVRNPYEDTLRSAGVPEPEMVSKLAEPAGTLTGVPFMRQAAKTLMGLKRGETVYDSLMGWYSEEGVGSRPTRESRSGRSRSRGR